MVRRLPVYILIDTSGSMKGEPIESVKVGLESMMSALRSNAYALETVWVSIISYDRNVKQLLPLTPIDLLQLPEIVTPDSGPTHTGAALEMLCSQMDREIVRNSATQKGDWMPLLFLMTDGKPADIQLYKQVIPRVKRAGFANIICLAAGPKARTEELKLLSDEVYQIDMVDSGTMQKFFQWVSGVIDQGGRSVGVTDKIALPPPPDEINFVI